MAMLTAGLQEMLVLTGTSHTTLFRSLPMATLLAYPGRDGCCARRERPRDRRAADERDELAASHHSI